MVAHTFASLIAPTLAAVSRRRWHHIDPHKVAALVMLLIAALSYGVGSVFQGIGAQRTQKDSEGERGLLSILRHPFTLAGLVLDFVGWILSRFSLHSLPLFAVQTALAGSLAVTVALSHRLLHTLRRRSDTIAIAVSAVGLVLVGVAARGHIADTPSNAFNMMMYVALPVTLLAGLIGIQRKIAPPILGVIAGTSFGFSALSARAIVDVDGFGDLMTHRFVYIMLAFAAFGVVLFTRGVERGHVASVTAAMWASEILPASVIGFTMLGDRVRHGWAPAALLGIAMTLGATIALASADAPQTHG